MLEFDRTDVSGEIDVNKISGLRNCVFWHYWNLFGINCRLQPKVCKGCHDLIQKATRFNDVAIFF